MNPNNSAHSSSRSSESSEVSEEEWIQIVLQEFNHMQIKMDEIKILNLDLSLLFNE